MEKGRVEGPLPCFPFQIMFQSPLIRRVSIYLLLSTAAVTGLNLLDVNQQTAAPIYIPLFIGIYILSRWIDSRLGLNGDNSSSKPTKDDKTSEQQGFKP